MGFVATIGIICIALLQVHCGNTSFTDLDLTLVLATFDAFCPKRCGYINVTAEPFNLTSRFGVNPPAIASETCCSTCSCDDESCRLDGSCCPDAFEHIPTLEESASTQPVVCRYPQLKPFVKSTIANAPVAFVMHNKCSFLSDATSDIISKCEQSDMYDDIYTKIPVTDTSDIQIYINRYCAYCNHANVSALKYWEASVKCIRDTYIPSNVGNIVSDVRKINDCNLIFGGSMNFMMQMRRLACTPTIGTCNETGHWAKYDPVIEAACQAYGGPYTTYKNVFCYLCNTAETEGRPYCYNDPGSGVVITFSALLNFTPDKDVVVQEDKSTSNKRCGINQLVDSFKDICRNLTCLPPKLFRNGSCHNSIDYITGVQFKVFLKMTPTQEISNNDLFDTVFALENHTNYVFAQLKIDYALIEFDIFYRMKEVSYGGAVDFFVIYFKFYSHPIVMIYLSSIDSILAMDERTQAIKTHKGHNIDFYAELEVYEIIRESNRTRLRIDRDNITLGKIYTSEFRSTMFPSYVSMDIVLTRLTGCPLVSIGNDEFTITTQTWGITIQELNTQLKRNEYTSSAQNDSFLVCADLYKQILIQRETNDKQKLNNGDNIDDQLYVGVLSVVCTSVSVLFALMTLLTYSLFKSLRTQPGINNMGLLVSLICAQVLFQFGSGQAQLVSSVVCQILGILVHFSWLTVVFWMNVCSYHMYKVFSSQFVVGTSGQYITLRYCLYSSIASAIPVIINIVVVALESNGHEIGYGGNTCYISRRSMIGYVFALPVALVILSNIVMFLTVIIKLARTPKLDKHSERNRSFFVIYAKISTLTGIAWLFGFVYHFSGLVAFEYIFIILNAGQGVFIFLSFVCNRRVLHLFKELISASHENITRSSSNTGSGNGNASTNGSLETAM